MDSAFGNGGNAIAALSEGSARGNSLAVQRDGKIVVAGSYDTGARLEFALARYLPDGKLDPAFGTLGVVTTDFGSGKNEAYSVALQGDGKIVAAGYAWNGFNYQLAVARYGAEGKLDTTFGGDGKVTTAVGNQNDVGQSVRVQNDGRILVAGHSYNGTNNDFALVRYEPDGRLDTSFGNGGKVSTSVGSDHDEIRSAAIQTDGKIVVAGSSRKATDDDIALARYHANGTLDTEFGNGGKVVTSIGSYNDFGYGLVLQNDGKIVVGGYTFNGSDTDFALLRFRADGVRDTAFGNDGLVQTPIGKYGDFGLGLALQSDGKLIVGGYSVGNGNYDFALARYLADGKLDTAFGNGGKLTTMVGNGNDVGTSVAVQPDGKILVAGYSDDAAGRSGFALVRYLGTTEPEIAVEQPEGNNLTDGSATVSFGNRAVPGAGSTLEFTVRNASSTTLTGLAVSKAGTNAGDFALDALGATTLAPGASTTFTVTFTPGELGLRKASLHIASNDADENPFDIALTGKGVLPPQITTASPLPSGMTGEPYSFNLVASGGTEPYTWSVSSGALPAGLALSSLGILSGTPTAAGDGAFSVRVRTDESLEAVKELAITIQEMITWTNVAGGNWTDKTNWSPNKVPTLTSIVLINRPGTYTVTLNYNAQCQSLQLGGAPGTQSLDWKYGGFTGTMAVETNAVVNLAGGSLTLTGVVDNRGRILWPAGQLVTWHFDDNSVLLNRPEGLLDLQGHGAFAGGSPLTSTVHNEGIMRKSSDAGEIIVYRGVRLENAGLLDVQTGQLELQGLESSNVVTVASGAVIEMTRGVFNFQPGHSFGGTGTWWIHGTPTVNGTLDGDVAFTVAEAGEFNAQLSGAMWWTNGTFKGNLTLDKGAVLNLSSASMSGQITNYGQLIWSGRGAWYWYEIARLENMAGGVLEVTGDNTLALPPGASINNYGTIRKSGGTNFTSFRGQNAYNNYGLLDVRSGRLEFLHGLTSRGTINVAQNASVEFHGYDVNLGPNHKFTGEGTCAFGASSLHITGPIDGTVTFQMEYGTVFNATLNAPMVWKYGNPSGSLTVGTRGVLTMLAPGNLSGTLTNYGTVLWQSPQAASWRWSDNTRFYNASSGVFDMQGDHRFYGSFTNMAFENAGIFRKSKGTATAFVDSGFAFTNSGTLDVQSGKLWFRSPFAQTTSGTIRVSIGGVTPITQYSQVQFDKPPVFAGRFVSGTSGGFRPAAGASFAVLNYPSAVGGFGALSSIDLGSGLSLKPQFLPTSLVLTAVQSAALPSLAVTRVPDALRITLPEGYSDWRLFSATNIAEPAWELVPLAPGTTVDLPTTKPQEFFRLKAP
ncbi:MAG: choice-of-anchor D domain-containing protein [Verrucomicrobiia bacterium]